MTRAEQAARLKRARQAQQASPPATPPAPPAPAPAAPPAPLEPSDFDPADWPVADVLAHIDSHPEDAERVLELEAAGKGRKSILYRGQ